MKIESFTPLHLLYQTKSITCGNSPPTLVFSISDKTHCNSLNLMPQNGTARQVCHVKVLFMTAIKLARICQLSFMFLGYTQDGIAKFCSLCESSKKSGLLTKVDLGVLIYAHMMRPLDRGSKNAVEFLIGQMGVITSIGTSGDALI